ncbi:TrkA-N domain protein [Oscillochloris trichoides DG-6]|uniref:TrkA-N domain protein n=1 Tax=Oscillochloris trichoides DG-6 TaxID=765420 RepID=E1IE46_9CHLR|nr:NAD-binding protein [Oscillochloris trichoides]EFO80506.1 TrkA-N domain protein [Oscillochloris trichoides DG-6]
MRMLIIGGGQVGSYLASLLLDHKHHVTVVERRDEAQDLLRRSAPAAHVILGDGTDPQILEAAGVRVADVVAAVTGADETNLVITSLARFAFNVPRAVARVNNPHNTWMFTPAMGVDVALNQADVIAHLIAQAVG